MTEVRVSDPRERDELYELWARVFNEDRAWLDRFFSLRYAPHNIFVARVDGVLASALHALPASYVQGGCESPCAFIVGAATDERYRRRGLMATLLEAAASSCQKPITLFPAVRGFYEANGYTTTSSLLSFDLEEEPGPHASPHPAQWQTLDRIYRAANEREGYLVRDKAAWAFLGEGYQTVSIDDAYAFINGEVAVEAFALTDSAAATLVEILPKMGVKRVQTLPDSPLSRLLGQKNGVPTPMGMSTHTTLLGVYIAEQY